MSFSGWGWHDFLSFAVSALGALVILWGVALGALEFGRAQYRLLRRRGAISLENIRYDMGRHILLGLEFFIAADIIHTVIQPTLEEVAILAGIVAIRTVISFFLNREMERHAAVACPSSPLQKASNNKEA
jgi:uncharacterized membrane protein